ncbi:glycosyltransferase [Paludibacterium paludis]|uniref:O-antigen biosynthesis protein n=1 Tax=Paludibacterium paludis TaxID=1225769 RepID=A0A918P6Y6_9NEIS|nr:glycosyltransferase [Paludibacterium paludis]GGY28056.1 O-antigen biosynthesis protein [Paludibacterium paludis]
MISIVIPAYNYADYLPDAIDSVLSQGIEDIEIIVCDDASTDATPQIMARYAASHPSIKSHRNARNLGALGNINHAMSLAAGDYVLLLGADDYLEPGALIALSTTLDFHPELGFAYGRYDILLADGSMHHLTHEGWKGETYFGTRDELPDLLCHDCYINLGTTLFRRSVLDGRPFFDGALQALPTEAFFRATDWELMLRLARDGVRGAFLDRTISVFRQHGNQASGIDKYAVSGLAVLEHMELIKRYVNEANLPRLKGRLGGVFRLVYGKYRFYREHTDLANTDTDRTVRGRYHETCKTIAALIEKDADSVLPDPLKAALVEETGRDVGTEGPLFSVIVTTYNRPRLLVDALTSILAQTLQDWEIILVNDGGDLVEPALDWIRRDSRITYLRQPNRGVSAARNNALRLARGRYIAYLDDDDIMLPNHLTLLARGLERYPDRVVYTDSEMVLEEIGSGIRKELGRLKPYAHGNYDFARLQIANYIPINTFAHDRRWLDKVGVFDESLSAVEDWDLLIRLSRATDFHHIQEVTCEVRQRKGAENHLTGREGARMKALYERLYARYDDQQNAAIRAGRAAVLSVDHPAKASLFAVEYQRWLDVRGMRHVDVDILGERMVTGWAEKPMMTLLMKARRDDMEKLGNSIFSLQNQLYQNWRLIVVADFPAPDPVFSTTDILGWLEVDSLDDPARFAEACNIVVNEVAGDWIGLFPAGSEFRADWLLRCADHTQMAGKGQVAFYGDHDFVVLPGSYVDPQLKPDFNLEYLISWDYVGKSCWFNQRAVAEAGSIEPYPGAEGFELLLRLADLHGAGAIGHLPDPLLHLPRQNADALELAARRVAIENHLARLGRVGEVMDGAMEGTFKVVYPIAGEPLVSVIIPNRDKLEFLQPCIETLFAKTRYPRFEVIIVDNQSRDPDTLEYYDRVQGEYPGRLKVVEYDEEFNFSAQCNLGVREASGEYIVLLNNDVEIIQSEWMERLLMQAQHAEVGIAGAKLVYPETGKVQHAGILLGGGPELQSVASHYGEGEPLEEGGYMNRLRCEMYLSAVTAACMMIRRDAYESVGGFDEALGVLYNDVDFCLRVGQAGYRVLWSAYALLVHHHGKSVNAQLKNPAGFAKMAERNQAEAALMLDRWLSVMGDDPCYNRNLSLQQKPLSLEMRVPLINEPAFDERPRIIASSVSGGSGEYRVAQPLAALEKYGMAQATTMTQGDNMTRLLKLSEIQRQKPDVIVLQNAINDIELDMLRLYRTHFPGIMKVMTLDDLVTHVPEQSSLYRHFMANYRDARRRVREALSFIDRVVVSTEPLEEFARQFCDDVVRVPNRLKKDVWGGLQSRRNAGPKPRVGWVGAMQHKGDLEIIREVITKTASEVDWVFMGMWPEGLEDVIREMHIPVSFQAYPEKMASLNLDLAVAPLEDNPFNESKSNLRLLEYGALGWPVVCSDVFPYRTNHAPVARVANTVDAWLEAIRERVHDRDALAREGDTLKAWVARDYFLEDHLAEWANAYKR